MNSQSEERTMIREELSNMSFEDLQALKEKLGTKVVNTAIFGKEDRAGRANFKRENKNRPREISSKIPVSAIRPIVSAKKAIRRDPRFDDLSGSLNEEVFKSSYSFLEDIKAKEKKTLEKHFKKEQDPETKQKIKSLLQGMATKEKLEKSKEVDKELEKQWRHQQVDKIKEGKNPYFLKKSDKKKMYLAEKFLALKKSGKVENCFAKKRKKNAAKDKIKLPKL